jgi:hypothetical protein
MELSKILIKEKKLCKVLVDGDESDSWLAIDLSATHYVLCEVTTTWACWVVPKLLFNKFMKQHYRYAEKFEVSC